jgi:oligoribonuclease NrnB/cAMP/cGMP phosphodiesterase (DHH superfamily)
MEPTKKLKDIAVLYHGNCPDGTGAALAAYMALGGSADYIPVSYGQEPPAIKAGATVYILDFSYPRLVLEHLMRDVCNNLVVLDHHITAKKDLEGLPGCHFDMNKSGAVLAWEFFHKGESTPLFFEYLQDRDLWRFKLAQSREVSAAIGSYPLDFRLWLNWIKEETIIEDLAEEGITCLRLKNQQVDNMCKHFRVVILNLQNEGVLFLPPPKTEDKTHFGLLNPFMFTAPVANATVFFLEVGERLLELHPQAPFIAYYMDRSDGNRQWGLRSRKEFDVSLIAKAMGGGGHPQAAGFVQKL